MKRNLFRVLCIAILLVFFIKETLQIVTTSIDFFEKVGFSADLLLVWIWYAVFAVALILYIRNAGYGWHNFFLAIVLASWCYKLILSVIFSPVTKGGRIFTNIAINDTEITIYETRYYENGDLTIFKIWLEYSIQLSIMLMTYLIIFIPLAIYFFLTIKKTIKKEYIKWLNAGLGFIIMVSLLVVAICWFMVFEIFAQYQSKKILDYPQIGRTFSQQIADFLFIRNDINHFVNSLYFNPIILIGILLSFILVIREVLSKENHYNNNLKKKLWAH